ncbi:MAG TPA: IS200/IS605 family transposase [Saprospiraceae bacterium]|nr:IS200/IS605 family transposase [Saprospiraceae bacterium]
MPYLKVYIHFVWTTKYRTPYLATPSLRLKVWRHMLQNATNKGIFIDFINGYSDHCHCLLSLNSNQTIEKTIQLIKGESSRWINKSNLLLEHTDYSKFEWQDEYYGVSVSPDSIDFVREYIKNQEEHHKIKSFNEEYNEFMNEHGFQEFK